MPSLSNINKRDETASKPDTGKYGLEPFMAGGGFALVVCCPVYTVVGFVGGIKHQIKKRKQRKAEEQGSEEQGTRAQYVDERKNTTDDGLSKAEDTNAEGKGDKKRTDDSASPTLKRSEGHTYNPRVCNPECPGFKENYCTIHQGSQPGQPTSPGLLAV